MDGLLVLLRSSGENPLNEFTSVRGLDISCFDSRHVAQRFLEEAKRQPRYHREKIEHIAGIGAGIHILIVKDLNGLLNRLAASFDKALSRSGHNPSNIRIGSPDESRNVRNCSAFLIFG